VTRRKQNPAVEFITDIESVRLTNWSIRVAWKTAAGLIAIAVRLVASIILAILRCMHRRRFDW
jgi:hypothetical protein